ncbi:MAG TPA: MarR family transcriptional regulator [Gallicola sp.]|nr:MarR family transcriptional regulator [Gallicola sp.]
MNQELLIIKDEFLRYLYEISEMKMVHYIATFIQGEEALILRLVINGPMTPKELSDDLKITKGRVTAIINKLKKKNYLHIKINEDDRRSIIVWLTDYGREAFQEKLDIADQYFNKMFSVLGVEDARSLVGEISKLLIKLKEAGL